MNEINVVLNKINNQDILLSDLDSIINGSAPNTHCYIMDTLSYEERTIKTITLFKKISNKSEITIKFLDMMKLFHDYINGKISSLQISKIISEIKSIQNKTDITDLISENKHMKLIKSYNDNYYCVMVIQKNI